MDEPSILEVIFSMAIGFGFVFTFTFIVDWADKKLKRYRKERETN